MWDRYGVVADAFGEMLARSRPPAVEAPYPEYKDDPNGFLRDVVGFNPWTAQDAIDSGRSGKTGQDQWGDALVKTGRVAVVANNGSGKSNYAAGLILWFMSTRRNAKVVTFAPKWSQVKDFLWAYLRAMHAESRRPLPGQPLTVSWELGPQWTATGFSTDDETKAQGFHNYTALDGVEGDLLVIGDEASGVPEFIFNAMSGWLTKGNTYVMLIGNANVASGGFYEAVHSRRYTAFQVSAFDCPSFIATDAWIEEMREKPGEGTPQWTIRVEGQFTEAGGQYQFFPPWLLRQAHETAEALTRTDADRLVDALEGHRGDGIHIGVDLADTGSDQCVATRTENEIVTHVEAWNTDELMYSADQIIALAESWGITRREAHRIHVDSIGVGAGVCSRLRQRGWLVDGVDYGSKVKGDWPKLIGRHTKLANRKAELHQVARQMLIEKRAGIPRSFGLLHRQLGWLRWRLREGTTETIQVEPKKELAKRGIQGSPDYADSWILTFSRARARSLLVKI